MVVTLESGKRLLLNLRRKKVCHSSLVLASFFPSTYPMPLVSMLDATPLVVCGTPGSPPSPQMQMMMQQQQQMMMKQMMMAQGGGNMNMAAQMQAQMLQQQRMMQQWQAQQAAVRTRTSSDPRLMGVRSVDEAAADAALAATARGETPAGPAAGSAFGFLGGGGSPGAGAAVSGLAGAPGVSAAVTGGSASPDKKGAGGGDQFDFVSGLMQ